MDPWQRLAPFILATYQRRGERGSERIGGRKGSWSLHAFVDGRGAWCPPGAAPLPLGPDQALLVAGRAAGAVRQPPGSRRLAIYFDVVPRRREPHPVYGWRPVAHLGDERQPGVSELLDLAPPPVLSGALAVGARRVLERVCVRWWRSRHDQQVCNQILAGWFAELLELGAGGGDHPVERAERYARHALASGVTVAAMAAEVDMPVSTFCDHYLRHRGESAGAFLRQLAMTRACEALAAGRGSQAAAGAAGFRNRSSFARAFRAVHGCSPRTWQRRQRGDALP